MKIPVIGKKRTGRYYLAVFQVIQYIFMKAGMLLHLLESTDWVTTKKQHIENHLNQGVEFSY